MTTVEALKQALDTFTDDELQQISEFMEFLKFRTRQLTLESTIEDTPKAEVLADFRQAWQEAATDQGIPVAQLWAELEHA
jgi:ABC-type phosphate transport system auxiliary subunit